MNHGDLGKRALAFIFDSFLISIAAFIYGYVFGIIGLGLIAVITAPILTWLYFILMEGGTHHATIGKKIMGLYVADESGAGITYSRATLRLLGKVLDGLTLGVGYLMGFFTEKKQCLHDMLAGTYVLGGIPDDRTRPVSLGGQPKLVAISGALAGRVYSVTNPGLLIGRDTMSCQVVLPSNQEKVSRTHCFITYNSASGMFVLSDRNSTCGTYLANGCRIKSTSPTTLRSGDRFYVATTENTFEVR